MINIPQYIAIGHITHDLVGNGITPGGPALYAACTSRNLGLATGMLTSFSQPLLQPSLLHDIQIHAKPAKHTTTFVNLYNERGERRQIIESVAEPLSPDMLPPNWQHVPIVNICPVANEYTADMVRLFAHALIGVCPQGWMRRWNQKGQVFRKAWENFQDVLPEVDVVFFSEEDVDNPPQVVQTYLKYTKMVVVTQGKRGATAYTSQRSYQAPAFPANEVDPTGAGDVFATAFLIKYFETRDIPAALRFANCVASFVVEKEGIYGIPLLEHVHDRLKNAAVA